MVYNLGWNAIDTTLSLGTFRAERVHDGTPGTTAFIILPSASTTTGIPAVGVLKFTRACSIWSSLKSSKSSTGAYLLAIFISLCVCVDIILSLLSKNWFAWAALNVATIHLFRWLKKHTRSELRKVLTNSGNSFFWFFLFSFKLIAQLITLQTSPRNAERWIP